MNNTIDACGRSCPEPVLLTKKALSSGEKNFTVLVDNSAAAGNVTRFAENAGFKVSCSADGEIFKLAISK